MKQHGTEISINGEIAESSLVDSHLNNNENDNKTDRVNKIRYL